MSILQYVPYVLLFAVAVALIYAWGLWRSMTQNQDLTKLLFSKGVSRIRKTLKKKKEGMTRAELENAVKNLTAEQPFSRNRMGVTNPRQFLDSVLPYMVKQRMITEEKVNGKILYRIKK